jgi:hypothetical protein
MSNIQKTLDSLQPYVISIRYVDGTPVVDAIFKEGWTVPDDSKIKKIKGNDDMNYFMIFSEVEGIGLDELLAYVDRTIKLNQEREKKHDLLRKKVNELKELFKKTSLTKLSRLKFGFEDEDLTPKLDDFDVDDEFDEQTFDEPSVIQTFDEPSVIQEPNTKPSITSNVPFLDEDGKPIEMTEEEKEMLEEEARAERNRKVLENKKPKTINPIAKKVELPPKPKPQLSIADNDFETDCECGSEEACEKCIDQKGY